MSYTHITIGPFGLSSVLRKLSEKRARYLIEKGANLEKLSDEYMKGLQKLEGSWETSLLKEGSVVNLLRSKNCLDTQWDLFSCVRNEF